MGKRQREKTAAKAAKKKGGILIGMRSGVQKAASKVTGGDDKKPADDRTFWRKHWFDAVLVAAALGIILYKMGIIKL
jgi:hypothetical protein